MYLLSVSNKNYSQCKHKLQHIDYTSIESFQSAGNLCETVLLMYSFLVVYFNGGNIVGLLHSIIGIWHILIKLTANIAKFVNRITNHLYQ